VSTCVCSRTLTRAPAPAPAPRASRGNCHLPDCISLDHTIAFCGTALVGKLHHCFHTASEGYHHSPPCCLLVRRYKSISAFSITHSTSLAYKILRLWKISDYLSSTCVSINEAEQSWQQLGGRLWCIFPLGKQLSPDCSYSVLVLAGDGTCPACQGCLISRTHQAHPVLLTKEGTESTPALKSLKDCGF